MLIPTLGRGRQAVMKFSPRCVSFVLANVVKHDLAIRSPRSFTTTRRASGSGTDPGVATMHHRECTVESILGVSEMDLVQLSSEDRGTFFGSQEECFVHRITGYRTAFGTFEVVPIAELRRKVEALAVGAESGARATPPLTIRSKVDIGQLQGTLRTEDRAMVQVASNFNCLETPSLSTSANCGYLVDKACRDRTQGPAAVFGPLSAYLYRAHFVKLAKEDGEPQLGQTKETGVNLLHRVSQYFGTPVNGKLLLQGDEAPILAIDAVVDDICIGLHANVPVLFTRDSRGQVVPAVQQQHREQDKDATGTAMYPHIDQVFAASINLHRFGQLSLPCLDHSQGDAKAATYHMARTLLRAAYEGLYLAAILQGRRQLYLTLVGGGSFGNRLDMILEEMERAHDNWAGCPASQLEVCQICVYSTDTERVVRQYFGS